MSEKQLVRDTLKEGDVYFFSEQWGKKSGRTSFVSHERSGKIIISNHNYERAGLFEIEGIRSRKENCTIVKLGKRIPPDDLYPEINLEEAKSVLKKHGFETFVRDLNFDHYDRKQNEKQLLAWNKEYGVWVNGTTWDGGESFNNLEITFPNYRRDISVQRDFDVHSLSGEEAVLDIVNCHEIPRPIRNVGKTLGSLLFRLEENRQYIERNKVRICIIRKEDSPRGELIYKTFSVYSYAYEYMGDNSKEIYQETYDMLPDSGKEFVIAHSKASGR